MARQKRARVLIIDDEADIRSTSRIILEKEFDVLEASSGEEGLQIIATSPPEVVICDIRMPGMDGIKVLEKIKKLFPEIEVIMQTAVTDTKTTVQAIKLGAYDYLLKPAEPDQLLNICRRALEKKELLNKTLVLEAQLDQYRVGKMLGKSKAMQEIFKKIKKVANSDVAVLITGETGTGKELVAQAIHNEGSRKDKPFIAINCGGIPTELLEAELFGYEKGSFTSADSRKLGKLELANGGTVFLDEIGNMPKTMQAKMLRVLQEKEIDRVGGTKPIPVDIRIISATNEDLPKCIKEGKFREDLYHRLNVIPIHLPPLRERKEDIPLLAEYFFEKYNKLYNGTFKKIGKDTMEILEAYSWPGNIREMQHLFQRLITLEDGPELLPKQLPPEILGFSSSSLTSIDRSRSLPEQVAEFEKNLIENALRENKYNIQKAADALGVHRSTLSSKIQAYNIEIKK